LRRQLRAGAIVGAAACFLLAAPAAAQGPESGRDPGPVFGSIQPVLVLNETALDIEFGVATNASLERAYRRARREMATPSTGSRLLQRRNRGAQTVFSLDPALRVWPFMD